MKLHEDKVRFYDAILMTSQMFKIPEIYIEKDYWVTVALYEIFHSGMAMQAVFKGGTSLSKCYKVIERFSEDVDIVVICKEGETGNQRRSKIRKIGKLVEKIMPEITVNGLTNKKGNIRKTAHQYNRIFNGDFKQVGKSVVLEVSWLGSSEPFIKSSIDCYISEMMRKKGLCDLLKRYNLEPFSVQVLGIERTFCEKILSLVRFSNTDKPYNDLANKIRHVYDIHLMLTSSKNKDFLNSINFDNMLIKVGRDDLKSYKNTNKWLDKHPSEALIFADPEGTWKKIKSTYNSSFRDLVIGELPTESSTLHTLKIVSKKLKSINWHLH